MTDGLHNHHWLTDDGCRSILERLTPSQREVVVLLMEGYSQREAAEMLGITPEAAWRRMSDARQRLRET